MQALLAIALLLLLEPATCDDTMAYNISGNMMYQLSEILSPEECHSFYTRITDQEEFELEQLPEGNNPTNSHKRRTITNTEQCKKTLSHWQYSKGDCMCWDHLAEALQAIGRSDVSLEHLSKNLNEDKKLETGKDVEENHKVVETSSLHLENKTPEQEQLRQVKESTKILSDQVGLEDRVMLMLKTKSSPPYIIVLVSWIDVAVFFVWGFFKAFVLNILALCFFFMFLRKYF